MKQGQGKRPGSTIPISQFDPVPAPISPSVKPRQSLPQKQTVKNRHWWLVANFHIHQLKYVDYILSILAT